eukprot:scaffold57104_cov63-Phaeocystis_antarctica.AAC.2
MEMCHVRDVARDTFPLTHEHPHSRLLLHRTRSPYSISSPSRSSCRLRPRAPPRSPRRAPQTAGLSRASSPTGVS